MFDIFRTYSYINVYAHVCHKLYYNASFFRCEIRPCYNMLLVYIISGLWHVIFLTFTHGNEMETSHKKRTLKVSNFSWISSTWFHFLWKKHRFYLLMQFIFFFFHLNRHPKGQITSKMIVLVTEYYRYCYYYFYLSANGYFTGHWLRYESGRKNSFFLVRKCSLTFFYKNQVKTSLLIIIITCDTNTTSK